MSLFSKPYALTHPIYMNYRAYWVFIFCFLISEMTFADIIPTPQRVSHLSGSLSLKSSLSVFIQDNYSPENLFAAQKINKALKNRFGYTSYLTDKFKDADIVIAMVSMDEIQKFGIPENKVDEGYRLRINENIIMIEALYPQGVFYGAMTLVQLIEKAVDPSLKSMQVVDWPDFEFRGIADDISHGQVPTLETFKNHIDFLAQYKLNTYFLYLENALLLEEYPSSKARPDALSKKDIQELVKYAEKNFIEVIPYFETLTQQEGILFDHSFAKIAEFPGSGSLCPSCDYTYTYLESIIKDMSKLFPSRFIHIGGEVSEDIGFGKSRVWRDSLGIEGLHEYHFTQIKEICNKYNKQIITNYQILEDIPSLGEIASPVFTVLNQQESHNQTIMSGNETSDVLVFQALNNDLSIFPDLVSNIEQTRLAAQRARTNNALGLFVSNRSSFSYESFKELLYYNYAWLGQCAWNLDQEKNQHFGQEFFMDFWGIQDKLPEEVYNFFASTQNKILWKDFWRHPMILPSDMKSETELVQTLELRAKNLEDFMNKLSIYLDSLTTKTAHHPKQLDVLKLSAEFGHFYAYKLNAQAQIQSYLADKEKDESKVNQLIALMEENILKLEQLQEKYELTWKYFYRPEALEVITLRFKRLIYYFGEIKDQLLIQRKLTSPLLQSKWIVDCNELDTLDCQDTTSFRKDFLLDKIPQRAYLQVMANSFATVYVNDELIGEVSSRESNLIFSSLDKAKIFDIKSLLKEGNNKVIVKVINYNRGLKNLETFQGAALNASIMIRNGMKEKYWHSGDDWLVIVNNPEKQAWKRATIRHFPYPIIAPNFLSERTSWIEK